MFFRFAIAEISCSEGRSRDDLKIQEEEDDEEEVEVEEEEEGDIELDVEQRSVMAGCMKVGSFVLVKDEEREILGMRM